MRKMPDIGVVIGVMTSNETMYMNEFLYQSIFLPAGAEPLPRDVIYKPNIYIYMKDFGAQKGDCGVVADNGFVIGMAWTRIIPASIRSC